MALDIYWESGGTGKRTWIGSLAIDDPLEDLLYKFWKSSGVHVDPYGKGRVYLNQWESLMRLADDLGYPVQLLREVQAGIPASDASGRIVTVGD